MMLTLVRGLKAHLTAVRVSYLLAMRLVGPQQRMTTRISYSPPRPDGRVVLCLEVPR